MAPYLPGLRRRHHLIISYLILVFTMFLQLAGFSSCITDEPGSRSRLYPESYGYATLKRSSFPEGFVFGTSSSAYQYEGAVYSDGRAPSIWDNFTHQYPEKIADGSNGDVTVWQYQKYKEDISIIKEMGVDAYRFSISWSRIIPKGRLIHGVDQRGIDHYNDLINGLLKNGIEPIVVLFHWDLPQALEDEYGGFLSDRVVADFQDYADLCFSLYGDRVQRWFTVNEAYTFTNFGYVTGTYAPGRCSAWLGNNCTGGDSGTEPYLVAHHLLLAHATAVTLYRERYKTHQKGEIGMIIATRWYKSYSSSLQDIEAQFRALDFTIGWFMAPITTGDYPYSMRILVGDRLPKFTKEQSAMVNGSLDFLGLNYYTSRYVKYVPCSNNTRPCYTTDGLFNFTTERNGKPIGPRAASSWLYIYPRGIRKILLYITQKYLANKLPIFVMENGCDEENDPTLPLQEQLNDTFCRIDYHYHHLVNLRKAITKGANVKGYFAWSLMDNFEWNSGYTVRFGIIYVDYKNKMARIPKLSYYWFKNLLERPSSMEYMPRRDE